MPPLKYGLRQSLENEKIAEVTSFKSSRNSPLHESHCHHPSPDGEIAQCEHVSAGRAVVKHHTEEGHEESVALKTNCSISLRSLYMRRYDPIYSGRLGLNLSEALVGRVLF
jgi:hypothetical protein